MADSEKLDFGLLIDDEAVLNRRGSKNPVDPWKPYHYLVEEEFSRHRRLESVLTVFLTNQECPFRCTMCDLWKNTLDESVPRGAIPAQIDYALQRLPSSRKIKLYNSGNFFDPRAIPPEDYDSILQRLDDFDTLIVENHPRLCGRRCLEFQERCDGRLEVALGLETAEPEVLQRLNKGMDLNDFDCAVERLLAAEVTVRAFVLLQPPFLRPEKSVDSCLRTLEHAFSIGVDCCAVIPTRGGNGLMEKLQAEIGFHSPSLRQLEQVADQAFRWKRGRILIDLWDIEKFSTCEHCQPARVQRLRTLNETQTWVAAIECDRCDGG
jgi:radical SAM enzyme (TIGR01210 family)